MTSLAPTHRGGGPDHGRSRHSLRRWLAAAGATAVLSVTAGIVSAPEGTATTPATIADTSTATSPTAPAAEAELGRVMLVLDASGSMNEQAEGGVSKLVAAKRALRTVVNQTPADADLGLRVYGANPYSKQTQPRLACSDSQLLVAAGSDNRDELRQQISAVTANGETPIGYALDKAADDLGSEGTRSIVLVSDGLSTCAPHPCTVAKQIAGKGIDLRIDVVGLGVDAQARRQLECIAETADGTYYDADSADEIVDSIDHAAGRAVRPFTLSGTRVEGASSPAGATLLEPGQYVDSLGPRESRSFYAVRRTIPGSTLHLSATTQGSTEGTDHFTVEATLDGARCGYSSSYKLVEDVAILSAAVNVGRESQTYEDACARSKTIVFEVARGTLGEVGRTADLGLLVVEEPPVADLQGLPELSETVDYRPPRVSAAVVQSTGGASFDTATPVGPGRFASRLLPGEVQLYRIDLAWGEQLSAEVLFPRATPKIAAVTGRTGPLANIRLYTPMRADVDYGVEGDNPIGFSTGTEGDQIFTMTPPVRYLNRDSSDNDAYLPGPYYVAVSVNNDSEGDSYLLPYTLELDVRGTSTGVPRYEDDAEFAGPEDDSTPDETTTPPAATDEPPSRDGDDSSAADSQDSSGSGGAVKIVAVTGLGVVGLACVGLAARLLRRTP